MKTIFYYKSYNPEQGDYWFDKTPYNQWFELENTLYEPSANISKRTIKQEGDRRIIKGISITEVQDTFSDGGIVRRIALYIVE